MPELRTLVLTLEFLEDLTRFSRDDQRRVLRALAQLDADERTPSLRVHELQGKATGQWSASASKSLRITFERPDEGRKVITISLRDSLHFAALLLDPPAPNERLRMAMRRSRHEVMDEVDVSEKWRQ